MFYKQTKISDSSEVIYTTSKNDLKMMWLSRNTKVMDSFSPQKQEFFWKVIETSTNDIPTTQGKRIMDCTQLHASIT